MPTKLHALHDTAPRRRRGTGSRGLRARGDPFLDREAVLVDRGARDRARRAAGRRLERGERARGRRAIATPPLAITGTADRAEHVASCSMSGPPSMPSRLMSVTTSAPTPGRSKRCAVSTRSAPVDCSPAADRRRRGHARRARPRPAAGRRRARRRPRAARPPHYRSTTRVDARRERALASFDRRTPPPVCTLASTLAQMASIDRRFGCRRRAPRRGRRRGSSARPPRRTAARPRRDRRRSASRGRSRPVAAARRGRRAGRSPDRSPQEECRPALRVHRQHVSTKFCSSCRPDVARLLRVELRRPQRARSIAAAKRRPYSHHAATTASSTGSGANECTK